MEFFCRRYLLIYSWWAACVSGTWRGQQEEAASGSFAKQLERISRTETRAAFYWSRRTPRPNHGLNGEETATSGGFLSRSPLLVFVLFTLLDSILSKHHIRHHRDRFKRQQGAHLYLPGTFVTSGGDGPDRGPWGEWSAPSPCSRTCGGGVSSQQRECQQGYECQGSTKRHFSCNTQDCPDIGDYRSQQCSEYDRIPFEGVYYQWIPYTKAPNVCELNCMPRGERFYYRHKQYVVDGTPCTDEKLDVCVEGTCQPVGCDMMLGSDATEDRCRQCGGDGSMCNTVAGVLDMQDLQVGYNDILLIPTGATNVAVREVAPSNNYLAVRNTTGYYYLNGNWRIDFPRSLDFAGCKFHYDRYPKGFSAPDSITCVGPTDEPLFIVLLYQDVNVGVQYEYSIPRGVQPGANTETYAWTFDEFTPCSATCGGGFQYRNVSCAGRRTLEPADRTLCDGNNEPAAVQRCGDQPCEPQWVAKPWDRCSAPCGNNGTQTRQVYCEQVIANGVASIVDDQQCINIQKPETEQPCNQGVICASWHVEPWKACDHLCGEGLQTRKVTCYRKTNGKIEALDDSQCVPQEEKPESQKKCNLRPCEGVDWVTSEWSGCENKCGLANETRRVECATLKGEVFPKELCADLPIPELVRQCNTTDATCNNQWYSSQWSECSAKCGSGVQTRKVFCGTPNDEGIKKVEDSNCDPAKKFDTIKNCTGEKHNCTGEWFSGPWSKCSKECGGGQRTRKVVCLREDVAVAATECDPNTIAFSSEECNSQACSEDQILTTDDIKETDVTKEPGIIKATQTTKALTSPDKEDPSKEDEEYEEFYDDECEGGEWVDDEEKELSGTSPLSKYQATLASGKTFSTGSEEESTEPSLFTDDLMLGDDTTAYSDQETKSTDLFSTDTGSGDGDVSTEAPLSSISSETSLSAGPSSTVEGSGDYSDSSDTTVSGTTKSGATTEESGSTQSGITDSSDLSSSVTAEGSSKDTSGLTTVSSSVDSSDETTESGTTDSSDLTTAAGSSDLTSETDTSDLSSAVTDSSDLTSASSSDSSDMSSASSDLSSLTPTSDSTPVSDTTLDTSDSTPTSGSSETSDSSVTTDMTTDITGLSSEVPESTTDSFASTAVSGTTAETPIFVGESDVGAEKESKATTLSSESTESSGGSTPTEASTDVSGSTVTSVSEDQATDVSGSSSSDASTEGLTAISSSTDSSISVETGSSLSTEAGPSSAETGTSSGISSASSVSGEASSTTEFTGSTESTTEYTGSTEFDIWSSTTESGLSSESTEYDIWGSTPITDIFSTKKMRKCRKKKKKDCSKTKFGCCIDKVTPAQGPFDKGCPVSTTCKETPFGCCEDGVSVAKGKDFEGCPSTNCNETLFGCCPDNKTAAEGSDNEGCPPPPPECLKTKYGCCSDNTTAAKGTKGEGCTPEEELSTVEPTTETVHCSESTYGCCPDGSSTATGEDFEGCDIIKDNCTESYFGCCPDRTTSATGPNYKGCKMPCEENQYGCCEDGVTPAHGPNREGCCLATQYGCCPDNIRPAQGPNLEGCGCQYSPYRCCPDNLTAARGYNNEGCGCQYTEHGCCPDNYTPAAGPDYSGCQCHTFQFGCCPDGTTTAQGPHQQGCGCRNTQYGCCSDDQTPAQGPNREGCGCDSSKYGCCLDGTTEAQGDNYEGCEEVPVNLQASCTVEKERGPCRNYTVKWFFDMEYGGCSRFWYGGCDGNGNRFKSKEECNEVCVEPQGPDRCSLPKVAGACEGYYPQWYYDTDRKTCAQFIYSGCLGNNNKFETREECMELCVKDSSVDACDQPIDEGPCRGSYLRWYFNKETNGCEQFRYGGCKPNNNNFPTEFACKQQCKQPGRKRDHCSLPRAQGNCTGRDPRWYYDASEKRCMPFYYSGCDGNSNNFASQEACEADCPKDIVKDTCQFPAEVGDCGTYTDRWYYDTKERRCRQFYYGGCGGNGNNFVTEQDCQQRCEAPATAAPPPPPQPEQPQPEPPQPEPQQPQPPQPERPIDVRYDGQEPFRQDFCFLDNDSGPCREYNARWYYDRGDGACKQFMYGGCQGNGNNFQTDTECQEKCGNVQDLCTLPVVVGPCSSEYESWYYNQSTDSCQTFNYGGCLGNNNRFDDRTSCEQRCRKQPAPDSGPYITQAPPVEPYVPTDAICTTQVDPGNCSESILSYYYDPSARRCSAFVYTGCGGNANRYNSEEQCERQCGKFRGQDVCRLPRDLGPCRGYFPKYYYDTAAGQCGQFAYGGCDGNGNRFSSQEECEEVCLTHEEKKPPIITDETASAICRLPLDVGPCEGGYHKHYYFDDSRGECVPFIYSGCGGNFNNFKTFQACLDFCKEFMAPTEAPNVEPEEKGEHPCQKDLDECETMRCEYGREAYVDDETMCTKCRCHNPCRDVACEAGTECAVDLNRNITSHDDPTFIAICRPTTKDGECPQISISETRCERECENDAQCSMDLKCCSTGCGSACVEPVLPVPAQLVTAPPYLPAYTDAPIQAGYYPPTVDEVRFEPEIRAGEGDYATLQCAVQGNPTPTISWRKGDLLIDGNQPRYRLLLDGALQIITLHKTDSGIYLCAADNGVGQPLEKAIKLEVTDSDPHSTSIVGDNENSQVVAALGAPTTLHCYATGYPFPAVTWWKDDSMIPLRTSQFEVHKDYSLLIHSVQLSNLGIYTCQAYNGVGKAASWSVTVQALGPVYSTRPEDSKYMQYVINPPERPTTVEPYRPVYPYRPEPEPHIPPSYVEPERDPNEILPLPPAEANRVYQVPVRTNITQTQKRFPTGSDISIGCDVDGYPIPQVQWYKDGQPLYPSPSIQISESHRLHISGAKESDAGEYRCEAANDYSRSASTVNIAVEGLYIHPNCTDNQFFANCELIVRAQYCVHKYYARFCCKSCTEAGQLPSYGPHLDIGDEKHSALSSNLVRRK